MNTNLQKSTILKIISNFVVLDDDKIEVFSKGFDDIDTDDFDRFSYSANTGDLAFDEDVFATFEEGLDFRPELDIIINPD